MHPRVSLHQVCFPESASVADDLRATADAGFSRVGLWGRKIGPLPVTTTKELLSTYDLTVSTISHGPLFAPDEPERDDEFRAAAMRTLDIAAALPSATVYCLSGGGAWSSWDDLARAFVEFSAPVATYARELGIPLLLEATLPLHREVSFLHSLRDTMDLAAAAGLGVVLDVFPIWAERGLERQIRDRAALVGLCQVCDYAVGTQRLPARRVPGDGDIPVRQFIEWLLDAGYEGGFELEIQSPELEAEGIARGAARAGEWLSDVLDELGA
ncbi:MAG: sugar phosphate isomerase/epimerase family protein [Candidatus Nanopelagicales bacterium]